MSSMLHHLPSAMKLILLIIVLLCQLGSSLAGFRIISCTKPAFLRHLEAVDWTAVTRCLANDRLRRRLCGLTLPEKNNYPPDIVKRWRTSCTPPTTPRPSTSAKPASQTPTTPPPLPQSLVEGKHSAVPPKTSTLPVSPAPAPPLTSLQTPGSTPETPTPAPTPVTSTTTPAPTPVASTGTPIPTPLTSTAAPVAVTSTPLPITSPDVSPKQFVRNPPLFIKVDRPGPETPGGGNSSLENQPAPPAPLTPLSLGAGSPVAPGQSGRSLEPPMTGGGQLSQPNLGRKTQPPGSKSRPSVRGGGSAGPSSDLIPPAPSTAAPATSRTTAASPVASSRGTPPVPRSPAAKSRDDITAYITRNLSNARCTGPRPNMNTCFEAAFTNARRLIQAVEPFKVNLSGLSGGSPSFGWRAVSATVSNFSHYKVSSVSTAKIKSTEGGRVREKLAVNSSWMTPAWHLSVDLVYHSWARNGTITYRAPTRVWVDLDSVLMRLETVVWGSRIPALQKVRFYTSDLLFTLDHADTKMATRLQFLSWLESEDIVALRQLTLLHFRHLVWREVWARVKKTLGEQLQTIISGEVVPRVIEYIYIASGRQPQSSSPRSGKLSRLTAKKSQDVPNNQLRPGGSDVKHEGARPEGKQQGNKRQGNGQQEKGHKTDKK